MLKRTLTLIAILTVVLFAKGFTETRGIKISVRTPEGSELELYQSSYALVVGVSDYTNGWPDLPNAVSDATEVTKELEKHGYNVILLTNPTKSELENALSDFVYTMGTTPGNRLLFYFAGHGYTTKMAYGGAMGYIVPADAPLPSEDMISFRRKAISMQTFESNARQIQAKHVLYLFDSCFSGSIFALSRAVPSAISYKTARPVRQFITAGDEGEEVPDKSVFKSQFVEGLNGSADLNSDGYITGTEFGEFLQTTVVNYSKEAQHPQYGKIRDPQLDKGDYIFVIPSTEKAVSDEIFELVDYDMDLNLVTIKIDQSKVKKGDNFTIRKQSRFSKAKDMGLEDRVLSNVEVTNIFPSYTEAVITDKFYEVNPRSLKDYYAEKIATGILKIRTVPWSTVYLDGVKIGLTPIIVKDIPLGEHIVTFEFEGADIPKKIERILLKENETVVINKNYAQSY
jgi:hypothetical protein